jgi:hypothetical protein
MKWISVFLVFVVIHPACNAQSDSLSKYKKRKIEFIITGTSFYGISVIGMNELWYKQYKRSSFHWKDDRKEWLQLDKVDHGFNSFYLNKAISYGLRWSGYNYNQSLLYSSIVSFLGVSTVEVFDGFSAGWGASPTDLLANLTGVMLYSIQYAAWQDDKIIPKYSLHSTKYASMRPEVFGDTRFKKFLKDYNGHTYWLSFNLHSLFQSDKLPRWLCLSLGYGGEGMLSGNENQPGVPYIERYRQYYLSMDIDLTKIKTRSKTLRIIFQGFNALKVPFPSIEFNKHQIKSHLFYF